MIRLPARQSHGDGPATNPIYGAPPMFADRPEPSAVRLDSPAALLLASRLSRVATDPRTSGTVGERAALARLADRIAELPARHAQGRPAAVRL